MNMHTDGRTDHLIDNQTRSFKLPEKCYNCLFCTDRKKLYWNDLIGKNNTKNE